MGTKSSSRSDSRRLESFQPIDPPSGRDRERAIRPAIDNAAGQINPARAAVEAGAKAAAKAAAQRLDIRQDAEKEAATRLAQVDGLPISTGERARIRSAVLYATLRAYAADWRVDRLLTRSLLISTPLVMATQIAVTIISALRLGHGFSGLSHSASTVVLMGLALFFGSRMSNVAVGILQVQGRLRREVPIDALPGPPNRQLQGAFLARMHLSVLFPLVRWRLVRYRLVSPHDNPRDGRKKLVEDPGEPPLPRNLRDRILARWWDRNVVTLLATPLLGVLLAVTVARLTGHWRCWPADAIATGGTGAIAVYVIDSMLSYARQVAIRVIRSYLLLHPHDELLLDLLTAASLSTRYQAIWFRSVTSRDICHSLEQAACRAERSSRMKTRVVPQDRPTRSCIREDGFKIAAVLRAHKQAIAQANGPGKYQQVCESLCSGILALASDDWNALTASAPATAVYRPRLLRLARLVAPALVLAAAGLIIPELPALHILPATASSTRITLLAAAILSLLPVPSSAADEITSALQPAQKQG